VTVTVPPQSADRTPNPACTLCGRPMADDQEWCLECGAARTVLARPPDWRVPVLVIGLIVLLVVGGLVFALTQLGDNAGKVTILTTSSAGTSAGRPVTLASWDPGSDGYTIILATDPSRAAAESAAKQLVPKVKGVGVIETSHYPELTGPKGWDVFVGRFPTYASAKTAAVAAVHRGESTARPALVQRPGGG
jgi:hypothetical protein